MKNFKIAAIIVAAALLVIGAAMTAQAKGWVQAADGWHYENSDGDYETDVMKQWTDGTWYYFDEYGDLVSDYMLEKDGNKYYFNESGARVVDTWVLWAENDDSDAYYYRFGSNGKAYKADTGKAVVKTIDDKKYVFNDAGQMQTGWLGLDKLSLEQNEGEYVYADGHYYAGAADDGALRVQTWELLPTSDEDEAWFFFKKTTGEKATNGTPEKYAWGNESGKFAFESNGKMITGWDVENLEATTSTAIASRYYDENGYLKTTWFKAYDKNSDNVEDGDKQYWFYADSNGVIAANQVKKIGSKYYGFDGLGHMVTGVYNVVGYTELNAKATFNPVDYWSTLKGGNLLASGSNYVNYYYFGDADDADVDGAMKMGTVDVTLKKSDTDDDKETKAMTFGSTGATKGKALDGYKSGYFYHNGYKITASSDTQYDVYEVKGIYIEKVASTKTLLKNVDYKKDAKKADSEVIGKGSKDELGVSGTYIVLTTSGSIASSGTKTDADDYKLVIEKDATVKTPYKNFLKGLYYLY